MSYTRYDFSEILKAYDEQCRGATLIVSPPSHIGIRPPNRDGHHPNEKEKKYYQEFAQDPDGFRVLALRQWQAMVDHFEKLGLKIKQVNGHEDQFDHVFTADPFWSLLDNTTSTLHILRSCFTNATRHSEALSYLTLPWQAHFPDHQINMRAMKERAEGTGDRLYCVARDMCFSGHTKNPDSNNPSIGRSSQAADVEFTERTGIQNLGLELTNGCFHIDTCLSALPTGHMLVYKDGMTPESYEKLCQKAFIDYGLDPDDFIIEVSENDAKNNFATNLVCTGKSILMSEFGEDVAPVDPALINQLKDIGYTVTQIPYSQMIKVGGAIHCTAHLVHTRVHGGLLQRHEVVEPSEEQTVHPELAVAGL